MSESQPVSVETFAAGLGQRALHCRELGHNWGSWTVDYDKTARCYERRLRCTSCKTIRKQTLDSNGHVLRNAYTYPDGYLAPKGLQPGTYSRDVFRLESVTRFLDRTSLRTAV